ncbi:hypothetical protein M91_20223 [Bos mutus]|uniref:ubiquitinyl hydrolase 1 n=1 Tax=Bos mutus TaxID=72004 RepID=L8I0R9_9CETA|nr:hypothetical protein M91_20223 [Bos mutus]
METSQKQKGARQEPAELERSQDEMSYESMKAQIKALMEPQSKMMSHSNIVLLSEEGKEKSLTFMHSSHGGVRKQQVREVHICPCSLTYMDRSFPKRVCSLETVIPKHPPKGTSTVTYLTPLESTAHVPVLQLTPNKYCEKVNEMETHLQEVASPGDSVVQKSIICGPVVHRKGKKWSERQLQTRQPSSHLLTELTRAICLQKVEDRHRKYSYIRKTRAGGNCLYHAFGFSHLEALLDDSKESQRFKAVSAKSEEDLVSQGFPELTTEDFHHTFMGLNERVETQTSVANLLVSFSDQSTLDHLVIYLQLLPSGDLQRNSKFLEHCIQGGRTIRELCQQEVEPTPKGGGHILILALASPAG